MTSMDANVEINPDPATLEAEDFPDDTSDYGSIATDTTSVSSSVFDYQYENGRRYHAYRAGLYVKWNRELHDMNSFGAHKPKLLPNDDLEQERLDLQHHIFCLVLEGELAATRLQHPQNILDLGCGTGIWAIEMADQYPSAKVEGIDLSPIQPPWVPPNVQFIVDDVTQEWTYPPDSIDFVHARTLHGAIRDWPALLEQAYRHLKPGGRIEISEVVPHFHCDDGSLPADSFCLQWDKAFHDIAARIGIDFDEVPKLQGWLEAAGFISVERTDKVLPAGLWPKDRRLKEVGKYYLTYLLDAMESYSLKLFTSVGGWSQTEVLALLAHVRREVRDVKTHTYTKAAFITAQKPMSTGD